MVIKIINLVKSQNNKKTLYNSPKRSLLGIMVRYHREDGLNVFTFMVKDPTVALDALLDAQRLFSIGAISQAPIQSILGKGEQNFDIFILSGFPRTQRVGECVPLLVQGNDGTIGATYTYSFYCGYQEKHKVKVHTELVEVINEEDVKRVVYRHVNESEMNIINSANCCDDVPYLPVEQTESRFEIVPNELRWEMTFSFTGPSAVDPTERQGAVSFYCCHGVLSLIFLPCIPCFGCAVYDYYFHPSKELLSQIRRLQAYCNGEAGVPRGQRNERVYAEARVVQTSGLMDSERDAKAGRLGRVQEAVPLTQSQESDENTRAKQLKGWYELYKSGAISKSEYDAEKAKLLHDTL